jgi:putative modified peptide
MARKTHTADITRSDARVGINLSPREAVAFLQRLASDDQFRDQFEKNPQEFLAENHIHLPVAEIPEKVVLPSKEELQRVLERVTLGEEFVVPGGTQFIPLFLIFIAFFAFFGPIITTRGD